MKKLTQSEVKKIFKKCGCVLLDEYVGIESPVKYRCQCGTLSKVPLKNFKNGRRCKNCGIIKRSQSRRTSFEKVKKLFSDNNCDLLSVNYNDCRQLLEYRCGGCGCISKIILSNFKSGHRCKKCSMSGNKNPRWNPDREAVRMSESFRKRCYNLLHRSLKCKKYKRTAELLGYTPIELKDWIINSENWEKLKNKRWHLDHVFPIKAFTDYNIYDLKIINHLHNLRPIEARSNLEKQASYCAKQFEQWLLEMKYEYKK